MSQVLALHEQAMDMAEMAFVARLRGNEERARDFFEQAFEYEAQAAAKISDNLNAEPTRSVLHRSAASLAFNCGKLDEAERLIAIGLSGHPPAEIAQELRELLEQVNAQQNLSLPQTSTEPSVSVVMGADDERASITMAGALRFADSLNGSEGQIKIVDQNGKKHSIIVPLSMMSSIVKPLYEENVMVTGVQAGGVITLKNIVKVEEAAVMA